MMTPAIAVSVSTLPTETAFVLASVIGANCPFVRCELFIFERSGQRQQPTKRIEADPMAIKALT